MVVQAKKTLKTSDLAFWGWRRDFGEKVLSWCQNNILKIPPPPFVLTALWPLNHHHIYCKVKLTHLHDNDPKKRVSYINTHVRDNSLTLSHSTLHTMKKQWRYVNFLKQWCPFSNERVSYLWEWTSVSLNQRLMWSQNFNEGANHFLLPFFLIVFIEIPTSI